MKAFRQRYCILHFGHHDKPSMVSCCAATLLHYGAPVRLSVCHVPARSALFTAAPASLDRAHCHCVQFSAVSAPANLWQLIILLHDAQSGHFVIFTSPGVATKRSDTNFRRIRRPRGFRYTRRDARSLPPNRHVHASDATSYLFAPSFFHRHTRSPRQYTR